MAEMSFGMMLLLVVILAGTGMILKRSRALLYLPLICALMLASLAAGYARYHCETQIRQNGEPYLRDGVDIQLQGNIYKKESKNQQNLFYLDHVILQVNGSQFSTHSTIVSFADGDYPIGNTIVLSGTIQLPDVAANDGNFDAQAYYHSLNIDYLVKGESVLGVYGKTNWIAEKLFWLKEKLKENYRIVFSEQNAGVLTTMLLGDKELLETETKEIYQQAGVSHILTISGLHLSLIGMSVYRLLRRKTSFTISGIGSSVVLALYVCMIGAGISAKRALIMFLLMVLAQMLGRSYDSLTGISLAVLLLLWENPFLIFHAGFQFSVAAVFGATWVREQLGRILAIGNRRWNRIWETLVASVSIQLMTFPLVAFYYYEIPVYAVILNVVVANILSLIIILGIFCGVFGFLSLKLAGVFAALLEIVLHGITGISSACLRLPGAVFLVGAVSPGRIIAYYAIFFLALFLLLRFRGKYEDFKENLKKDIRVRGKKSVQAEEKNSVFFRKSLFVGGVLSFSIMFLLILIPEKNRLLCAILDVGQGDGIYLQPEENVHVFIDGGSSDVSKAGQYRILPFLKYHRVTSIDYWFVSHYDGDHINGLLNLLEDDYRVKNLFLPYEEPDNENYQQLLEAAKKAGTKVMFFPAGSRLEIGSCNIRALLPDAARSVDAGDANENCMVLYVTHPAGNMIFTGDAGMEDEQWILPELTPVKLLKVGHHGSKYSCSEEFLQALSPEYAVISCSSTNRYGHPHEETLERLENAGSKILCTMRGGQISFQADEDEFGEDYSVFTYK